MDIISKIEKTRARKLGRGSIRLQRGLFVSFNVWEKRKKIHNSNVEFVDNFLKKYQQSKIS